MARLPAAATGPRARHRSAVVRRLLPPLQADLINRGFGGYYTNWFKEYMLDEVGMGRRRGAEGPAKAQFGLGRGGASRVSSGQSRRGWASRSGCPVLEPRSVSCHAANRTATHPSPSRCPQLFNVHNPVMGIVFLGVKDSQVKNAAG